jgi:hypothetical protein
LLTRFFGKLVGKRGRKPDETRIPAFLKLCQFLESSEECQHSILDLQKKMKEFAPTDEAFTPQYLVKKLKDKYGDDIVVSTNPGVPNVLCFKGSANKALYNEDLA